MGKKAVQDSDVDGLKGYLTNINELANEIESLLQEIDVPSITKPSTTF